jgi:hypothetical protein
MTEIKFRYVFRHKKDGDVQTEVYTLDQIEQDTFGHKLHYWRLDGYKLIARDRCVDVNDSANKPIFENDILDSPSWWWGTRFVYRHQGKAGPCQGDSVIQFILASNIDNPLKDATYNLWDGKDVSVIGNIHQHPHLLAKE